MLDLIECVRRCGEFDVAGKELVAVLLFVSERLIFVGLHIRRGIEVM